jgi:hypothetical protein
LHSGAIAAKDLNGTISANSPGVGHGATFVLEIPIVEPSGLAKEKNSSEPASK